MIEESSFFLGDVVYVKDSHPFRYTVGNQGTIKSFVTPLMALVEFDWELYGKCYEIDEDFISKEWVIPLIHLGKDSGENSPMNFLLENEELRDQLAGCKEALKMSEELREELFKRGVK